MLRGTVGFPGNGKTLKLLEDIGYFVAKGEPVATNIELLPACPFEPYVIKLGTAKTPLFAPPVFKGRDIVQPHKAFWHYMPPGINYIFDELDNWFDSMDFARLNDAGEDVRLYFKQHEKRGDNIIYACQDLDNLWTRIRRMTQSWVYCVDTRRASRLVGALPKCCWRFARVEYGDKNMSEASILSEGSISYKQAQKMFGWYRRQQLLGDPSLYRWGGMVA